MRLPKESVVIVDHKPIEEATITAGEGNDGADVKSLLNPESRLLNRRRRDTPVDTANKDKEDNQQFPDAQGVSTIKYIDCCRICFDNK